MQFEYRPLGTLLAPKGYIRGPFGSALRRPELKSAGIPVYEQQQAIDGHRRFRFFIDPMKFEELKRFQVRTHDLIVSCSGTVGRISVIREEDPKGIISQALLVLRPDVDRLLPSFLYYFLTSPEGQLRLLGASHGAVQQNIAPRNVVEQIPTPTPPIGEQRQIAGWLGLLDERISLLRQTNATLEAIAQALFKSWFIDFDPVRAKAEGREPEGMDAATAALFPSEFEESPLGLIPKGWAVRSLDSVAHYLNGLALQKYPPESDDEFLPVIKIAQLRAGHTRGADRASARLKPDYIVRDGDVLFSWSGSLEVEFWGGGEGALNQHLFKVTSDEVPKCIYYLATKHFLPWFREIAAHKATTMGHIQRGHLSEAKIALPPAQVIGPLASTIAPLLDRRVLGTLQARELAAIRDSLLPRLISGKLRLPEAEAQMEDALA
ncbi:restriction endonuclease subunit S [Piscinibacterium candidicorallinum]|uniref:Restriction endonuclease subunit S n=1 Tax=Piscinibacterium candidicorallinum TaxID=1793872 RepID=A0ABV7GY45_9BURK